VLGSVGGNKSQAAKILNISRSTLREKLKIYSIA
jgi:DNA-binding protein Fis